MELSGTQVIAAPRAAVWQALNNPEVLKACLPGCESVVLASPEEFRVVVVTSIGPLRARFNGVLRMTDVVAAESCVMVFEGQGGAIGFGKGTATVGLRDVPEGTELTYTSKAQVGGKLAQVGSRLIDSVAKKMTDDFFKAFKNHLVPEAAEAKVPAAKGGTKAAAAPARGAAQPPSATDTGSFMVPGWWLIVAALLGSAITIVSQFFAR